ncbi:MAG: hypothetical protein A2452_01035 [Candidatus Firestonebacteria bacterium RIFOXYC2_FULL_39_67]|nr:MAG: hypothetical protein A2536_11100 [Candidatus Firestonebacteria bacterium RIFOXYD2_FULL_39_29]OGF52206.1 MAG: hypothetical protein A2497_02070 [Candidatus Firestonebacteria bacterium RifOxyC12_full_39_7]OGF54064.1 MAG: hypothetical protein A2452_01035 [Candidatus Firestonebacteria bacterium RIFOXYC2_FULL_39_67]
MNIIKNTMGSHRLMNRINTLKILNLLRENISISRIELSRMTKLDAKTITNIVRVLFKQDLIEEKGFNESSGGRPSEKLSIKTSSNFCIGVDLGATHVTCAMVDMRGSVLYKDECEVSLNESKESVIKKIIFLIEKCSRNTKKKYIRGIGMGLPGLFDRKKGVSVHAANLPKWKNVPVRNILSNKFDLPVYFEDCSRVMALGEMWYGKCKNIKDFIFLDIGYGIGCGIVNNSELQSGATNSIGEIGHIKVELNGKPCGCGSSGCLETVSSGMAIAREYKRRSGLNGLSRLTAKDVLTRAYSGDATAKRIVSESGKYLGLAISHIINILNPDIVVVGGKLSKSGSVLLKPMKDAVEKYSYSGSLKGLKIVNSELGDDAGVLGASALVLRNIFELEV